VAVVTNIALDHTDLLGATIPLIAREKAAIIERGDLAVTGAAGEGLAVIRRRARRMGAPLRVVAAPTIEAIDRDGLLVDLPGLGSTRVGLRGRHQAANVAVADATVDALAAAGIASVPPAARRAGYAGATWPGRLELLDVGGREVLLDGAHNPAGAAALAVALDDLWPSLAGAPGTDPPDTPPLTLVVASMADKDIDGMIRALSASRSLRGAHVLATSLGLPRSLPADDLAARWRDLGRASGIRAVRAIPDPGAALDRALSKAPGPVVIAGSLYLVGEARRRLVDDPRLRDPEDLAR
jgi:dihydrofolate synthase/folylpolyglutamate synthase